MVAEEMFKKNVLVSFYEVLNHDNLSHASPDRKHIIIS